MTLQQIYREGKETLERAGIAEAELDAWYLLEYVTGISRASYYGDPGRVVSEEDLCRYRECIEKRAVHIPLQHITGEQEFMGLSFRVNDQVLIPRQDTETLVEEALKYAMPGMRVLDLCTGSGCILISLLHFCPGLTGVGSDISAEALKMARTNGQRLHVEERAQWLCGDLFEKVTGAFDLIISNPPYIRSAEIEELQEEVRLYDPRIALDGAEDGLLFYRRIIEESKSYLKNGGRLLFEIGCDQGRDVAELLENAGYTEVSVKKDLAGLDRVAAGRLQ
ncbi:MAG TPA: peptide chain release factor N(5)-glutamine methyltransferase [Candidatus Dorea faecigallinarum]|nr:peptide chain release factor N(5)-glutamine methyltransferase [Candidatus Dorea faecigallinarum]